MIKITECPRDAMQGIHEWIPTETKIKYINKLLKVGFDTIDFGSFVSPKAIPQMRDTADVLAGLEIDDNDSRLLAIVANGRGARDAASFPEIDFLGYPFSVSETFQIRNTNATIEESLQRVADIQAITLRAGKELVVYISMGFGNPYGDEWSAEIVIRWVQALHAMGICRMALSDTIGISSPESISYLFSNLIPAFPDVAFGAHLHTTPTTWRSKVKAAYENGCTRYDGALKGYGGCPMAKDDLTGNMPTEHILSYLDEVNADLTIDKAALSEALAFTTEVFL